MQGAYHYHLASPCVADSSIASTAGGCDQNSACHSDVITYTESYYSSYGANPTGIAADGSIIWAMYNSNGDLWTGCDVDVCNGLTIDGYYGYALTSFHPYHVGCWGPGSTVYSE